MAPSHRWYSDLPHVPLHLKVIDVVWESQRRLTIFEPFENLGASSFSDSQGRPSSLSDELPGRTWRWADDWAIRHEEGVTDPEGWQYTTRLGSSGSYAGRDGYVGAATYSPESGQLSHARRRLWQRHRIRTRPMHETKYWEEVLFVPESLPAGLNRHRSGSDARGEGASPAGRATIRHSRSSSDVRGLGPVQGIQKKAGKPTTAVEEMDHRGMGLSHAAVAAICERARENSAQVMARRPNPSPTSTPTKPQPKQPEVMAEIGVGSISSAWQPYSMVEGVQIYTRDFQGVATTPRPLSGLLIPDP